MSQRSGNLASLVSYLRICHILVGRNVGPMTEHLPHLRPTPLTSQGIPLRHNQAADAPGILAGSAVLALTRAVVGSGGTRGHGRGRRPGEPYGGVAEPVSSITPARLASFTLPAGTGAGRTSAVDSWPTRSSRPPPRLASLVARDHHHLGSQVLTDTSLSGSVFWRYPVPTPPLRVPQFDSRTARRPSALANGISSTRTAGILTNHHVGGRWRHADGPAG